ncbi:MAG: hypothetical protein HHAS10_09270 [Candidatus Altimarinota bacterium]
MFYLTKENVLLIHKNVCEIFKNREGILHEGQLESLCAHIQNDEYYPTIYDKLAHFFFGLVQFHIFVDANKRTALLCGLLLVAGNSNQFGDYNVEKSSLFLEQLALSVATGKTKEDELPEILKQYFGGV